jgi:hypothetical protein
MRLWDYRWSQMVIWSYNMILFGLLWIIMDSLDYDWALQSTIMMIKDDDGEVDAHLEPWLMPCSECSYCFFNKVWFLCLLVNIFIFCVVPCCWVSIDICCCGLSSYHYMIFLWCANGQFSCSPEEVLHACHNLLVPQRRWSNTKKQFSRAASQITSSWKNV